MFNDPAYERASRITAEWYGGLDPDEGRWPTDLADLTAMIACDIRAAEAAAREDGRRAGLAEATTWLAGEADKYRCGARLVVARNYRAWWSDRAELVDLFASAIRAMADAGPPAGGVTEGGGDDGGLEGR